MACVLSTFDSLPVHRPCPHPLEAAPVAKSSGPPQTAPPIHVPGSHGVERVVCSPMVAFGLQGSNFSSPGVRARPVSGGGWESRFPFHHQASQGHSDGPTVCGFAFSHVCGVCGGELASGEAAFSSMSGMHRGGLGSLTGGKRKGDGVDGHWGLGLLLACAPVGEPLHRVVVPGGPWISAPPQGRFQGQLARCCPSTHTSCSGRCASQ